MTLGYITEDASQSYQPSCASDSQEQTELTTQNRLVTTGGTVGSLQRWHGPGGASFRVFHVEGQCSLKTR